MSVGPAIRDQSRCVACYARATSMQRRIIWSSVVGALMWLSLCVAGGFVVLARLGDYGSIIQPLIGAVMGLLGAVSHVLLSTSARFRRLGFLRRGVANWLCAYVPFVALAALFTNYQMAQFNADFWSHGAKILLLYTGAPMLCAALFVALITSMTGSPRGA